MTLDPTQVYAITTDGKVTHIRMTRALAEACRNIEKMMWTEAEVKIVPVLLTEIEDVK